MCDWCPDLQTHAKADLDAFWSPQGIRSVISRSYGGKIHVAFESTPSTITIRPDNFVSRAFSSSVFVKVLLWLVLVYPALLLFELVAGHKWHDLRCSFPLTRWRRLPSVQADEPARTQGSSSASSSSSSTTVLTEAQAEDIAAQLATRRPVRIARLPTSSSGRPNLFDNPRPPTSDRETDRPWLYLCGLQEGEFLRLWEPSIVDAVRTRARQVVLTDDNRRDKATEARDGLSKLRGYADG